MNDVTSSFSHRKSAIIVVSRNIGIDRVLIQLTFFESLNVV